LRDVTLSRLDVVGYPPRGNRRHCVLYAGSSTYAGLIRGYMDVTLSLVCRINMAIRHSACISSGRYNVSTLYNYRTSREYNTLRNGDHCSPDIRACKTWNAKKKGNQHRNSGEKEKEKSIRRQIIITMPVSAKIKGQKKGRWEIDRKSTRERV